jgi:hypothetical protein
MKTKQLLWMGTVLDACCCLMMAQHAMAIPPQKPLVRLAELEIDPAQRPPYRGYQRL